jgi:tetratricopeptide (TPR) repeat protein
MAAAGANLFYCNVDIFGKYPGEWCPREYTDFGIRYDNCIPILSIFARSLYEKNGGYKVAMGFSEDWEFWVNCSHYGVTAAKSDQKLFLYRSHDSGIAGVYIHDGYKECLAVVVVNDDDLYPVEQVLAAHSLMLTIRECSFQRAQELNALHPNQWFLKFWFALAAERRGEYQRALDYYRDAINCSGLKNWQPIFRLAVLLDHFGKRPEAEHLFFIVKTLRPDMSRIIKKFLDQGARSVPASPDPRQPLLYHLPADEFSAD